MFNLKFKIFVLGALLVVPIVSVQAAECGDITRQVNYGNGPETEVLPIENCDNPFNADVPDPFTYNLTLSGQAVSSGTVITIEPEEVVQADFSIDRPGSFFAEPFYLFRKEGLDYIEVVRTGDVFSGSVTLGSLVPGEYFAILTYEEAPILTQSDTLWKKWLKELFVPAKAQAFYEDSTEVVVIPFTIENPEIPPTGASSVLFLPGIQSSRLYTKGTDGDENKLWVPNRDADVQKLEMTEDGFSVNDIYTKDVIKEAVLPFVGGNIYKSFLSVLNDLENDGVIAESEAFAYDWRYSVQDIVVSGTFYENEVKSLITEIETLADGSFTGKVTIIGHSNGGLLAKVLISELDRLGQAELVDKVMFIGTPQLGTPKAIGVLLHGLDQDHFPVMTAETGRSVIRNMAGAYSLLPSQKYFETVTDSLITTDGSDLAGHIKSYGTIDSADKLQDFLLDTLDNRGDAVTLNQPSVLNAQIATKSRILQNTLDSWKAPEGVSVYEVEGTGLATIKGFDYRRYSCRENAFCVLNYYLIPFPNVTNDGDGTVVGFSASGYEGDKITAKINLAEENVQFLTKDREHKDLTESKTVQAFVDSVIKYPYLADTIVVPEFTQVTSRYTIVAVHSPVDLLAIDKEGNQVGVVDGEIKEEIRSSQYFEFGEGKYLIMPSEIDVTVSLVGTGKGVYSLTIDEVDERGQQKQVHSLLDATTTPAMDGLFTIKAGKYSDLEIDIDGDGDVDFEMTLDGEILGEESTEYSYADLKRSIKELGLKKKYEKRLLHRVKIAQYFSDKKIKKYGFKKIESRMLSSLKRDLRKMRRKGEVSDSEFESLKIIINYLK